MTVLRFDDAYKFYTPIKLYNGYGRFSQLGELTDTIGNNFLLVTGTQAMKRMGITGRAVKMLRDRGKKVVLYDCIDPNPTTSIINYGGELAVEKKCDAVIGLGGGSTIDAAKGIAVVAGNNGKILDLKSGRMDISGTLPIAAVPTTAGSGSESNRYFAAVNTHDNIKESFATGGTYPAVSILDPELTESLTHHVMVNSAVETLGHSFGAYICGRNSNAFTNMIALNSISLIFSYLPRVMEDGKDKEARSALMLAAAMGGIALDHGGAGASYGITMALGGLYNITHAQGIGIILPHAIEKAGHCVEDKMSFASRFLGLGSSSDNRKNAEAVINKLHKFLEETGFPRKLGEIGIKAQNIPAILEKCKGDLNLENDPGSYSPGETREFLEKII